MPSIEPKSVKKSTKQDGAAASDGYYRSLAELEQQPEFLKYLETEFPEQQDQLRDPLSRRRFMQLMGASVAFAGVASGCRWEEQKVAPLSRRPDDYTPGNAKHFATAMELGGVAQLLLAKSVDGRPIKLEGNPDHSSTGLGGGSSAFAQASILELYDPDRSQHVANKAGGASWDSFEKFWREHATQLATRGGAGLRILAEATSSPTVARLKRELTQQYPQAKWYEYEPISRDNERDGMKMAFGQPMRVDLKLDKAKTILALDTDLFNAHPNAREIVGGYANSRKSPSAMSRLYAVESVFSTTGAAADHRLPLRSELILPFLLAVEGAITRKAVDFKWLDQPYVRDAHGKVFKTIRDFAHAVAVDLQRARRLGVVTVGYRQPAAVHAVAARINSAIGAVDSTVVYYPDGDPRLSHLEAISALGKEVAAGRVETLVMLGGNPVYDAPANLEFPKHLAEKVPTSIHLARYENETSASSHWHLPAAHYLESWGDSRTWDGTVAVTQPLIAPLYAGRTVAEVLNLLIHGQYRSGKDLTMKTWGADAALETWRKTLHDGFSRSKAPTLRPAAKSFEVRLSDRQKQGGDDSMQLANGQLEVVFTHSNQVHDGRFANSSWLHEIPDFMTKSVWDNYAMVSPKTAKSLGLKNDTIANLTVGGRTIEVPIYVMPGQASHSIAIALGYGRTHAGVVGGHAGKKITPVGVNAYALRTEAGFFAAYDGNISSTGKNYAVGNTQDHYAIESLGRESLEVRLPTLVKSVTAEETVKHPKETEAKVKKVAGPVAVPWWDEHEYDHYLTEDGEKLPRYKWGMATDLSTCVGCNSCVVACQAENNIPVVGKDEVLNNREMQWLRIDRYFKGDKENPEVVNQPILCQHCENAPCEQVCPVGATIHTDEGLNDMIYNRCVGTRYCLNNCPYKVRRFNFFDWNKDMEEARNKVRRLLFNPEVTVRNRGVMEKCTFCVQRIQDAKIRTRNLGTGQRIKDGELQTACQQACPTGAIVFGNLNDETSQVAKLHADSRSYELLAEYLLKPRNLFLARVRNPNPGLVPADANANGEHH